MMNAVLYLRKSRAEENDSVEDTLRRHKETLLEYAVKNSLAVTAVYEEVVSGESLYARPQMLQLLEDADNRKFDAVLCMDIDRLGRGAMSDQGIILETLKNSDIRIITPRKVYDLNNDIDEEYTEFETFMARRELKMIKRRMQRGIRKTIEDGGYIANAPYGYERQYIDKQPSLKIKEDEAAFVRMIFDLYVNQGVGCQTVADTINALGAKPRRSDSFGRTSVAHILKNPTFCGKVVWDKKKHIRKGVQGSIKHQTIYNPREEWTIVDGLHPPIIDESLWNQAQEILKSRYHAPYFDGEVKNPLAGVVFCSSCGKQMQRRPYIKRGNEAHLLCPTRGCCSASKLEYVETALLEAVKQELSNIIQASSVGKRADIVDFTPSIKSIEKNIVTVKGQKGKLHDLLEQQIYDTATFLERMSELNNRETELSKSLELLIENQKSQSTIDYDATIKKLETALSVYEGSTPSGKNKVLKKIIKRAEYYKEKGWKPQQFSVSVIINTVSI